MQYYQDNKYTSKTTALSVSKKILPLTCVREHNINIAK